MSRRHHGRPRYHARVADGTRPAAGVGQGPLTAPDADAQVAAGSVSTHPSDPLAPRAQPTTAPQPAAMMDSPRPAAAPRPAGPSPAAPDPSTPVTPTAPPVTAGPRQDVGATLPNAQCTAPQLRRFIKSRPYVPMHELRRRFGIDGGDDDVTSVRLEPGWIYVGLPAREGMLLGELLRAGEIGYELSLDPRSPIVIGVYPMRPITRG